VSSRTKELKKRKKSSFAIRVVDTKYGIRVLIQQGDNRVWLSERHLTMLFQVLLGKIFEGEERGKSS